LTDDVLQLVQLARTQEPGQPRAGGASEAFAALIERFERPALGVAYAILRDPDRAGDAVQEAFLRAWQELPGLKEEAKFASWLMQIVRHAAIDARRRQRPTVAEFPDLAGGAQPEDLAERADRERRVKAALEELDDTTRQAVMLRYYDGLGSKQIAELLDVSPAAVDMRLSRARGILRERLVDLVDGPEAVARRIGETS
jgi:RNA polymerase sigma-70 factor (ECF subfamily)